MPTNHGASVSAAALPVDWGLIRECDCGDDDEFLHPHRLLPVNYAAREQSNRFLRRSRSLVRLENSPSHEGGTP